MDPYERGVRMRPADPVDERHLPDADAPLREETSRSVATRDETRSLLADDSIAYPQRPEETEEPPRS